ncbi:MAG: UDP-N-acetylglucosamine--N-acetylmuramyl-(pentapeptide) pyrophosphoryl-undecaprenol N-acetylglucosamine transferase, partial [Chloroflexi bacterium]|nr:UDP-N-acetylglucosamine--N-acetylmuramyl-(pentapeptide) pyrophosphoryl-undecaprenol N-acetylglucosamine transferase [Chloroflexota bacterium]
EPGLALKTISNIANSIALTTDESCRFFRHGKRLVTGYPVRPELAHWDRQKGRQRLGLEQEGPALLVSGGSRGARALNQAVMDNLPALLELAQVVHISGDLDWPTIEGVRDRLSKAQASRYLAYPYLHEEMGAALASADLVVSRAGASVLGEYPLFGLPAILVPYPYAWRYQKVNADYLVERGAAVLLENERLADGLLPTVRNLLTGTTQRQSMRQAMQGLAQPHAAARIAEELVALAGRR